MRLDGLSTKRTASADYDRMYYVQLDGHGGEIWISNSFAWSTFDGVLNLFDVYDYNMGTGTDSTSLLLWNDLSAFNGVDHEPAGEHGRVLHQQPVCRRAHLQLHRDDRR